MARGIAEGVELPGAKIAPHLPREDDDHNELADKLRFMNVP